MYPHPVTKKGPQVSQQWLETPRVPRLRSSRIHQADTNARSSDDIMRRSRIITPIAVLPLLLTLAVRDGKRMEFAGRHTMSEAPSFMKKVMFLRKDEKWATFCMPKFENLPTLANFPVWRHVGPTQPLMRIPYKRMKPIFFRFLIFPYIPDDHSAFSPPTILWTISDPTKYRKQNGNEPPRSGVCIDSAARNITECRVSFGQGQQSRGKLAGYSGPGGTCYSSDL